MSILLDLFSQWSVGALGGILSNALVGGRCYCDCKEPVETLRLLEGQLQRCGPANLTISRDSGFHEQCLIFLTGSVFGFLVGVIFTLSRCARTGGLAPAATAEVEATTTLTALPSSPTLRVRDGGKKGSKGVVVTADDLS